MFPTVQDSMAGELEITIGGVLINSNFLGAISPDVKQVIRTSERQSGTTSKPSNQLDNPMFTVPIYLNKWSDMQYIMEEFVDGESFVLGAATCTVPEPVAVNFHYKCDGEDESRDINLPVSEVSFEDSNERNANDEVAVNIHFYPQPNVLGQVVYGPMPTS